ncbi:hypothetical protein FRC03_000707 [Tulasnella sp. 419]|nr:hypothetical protein FRC02_004336 [Tulasnella sp. 418]KAG8965323.1 hypothetical protein FRC03_000707 [Tulasnella sp. 419]
MSSAVATSSSSESSFSSFISALAPNLPRSTALPRLRTNGLLLLVYVWVILQPTYYRFFKKLWVIPMSWIIGRDWAEYLTGAIEVIAFVCLVWNTFEAYYSLKNPKPSQAQAPATKAPGTPLARAPSHKRLQSNPKTPLPSSFTPSQTPASNAPFPALSFSPVRSVGTPQTSPFKPSQSFTSSLATSHLASSTTSSLNASFLSEVSNFSQRQGRALNASVLDRMMSELDTP